MKPSARQPLAWTCVTPACVRSAFAIARRAPASAAACLRIMPDASVPRHCGSARRGGGRASRRDELSRKAHRRVVADARIGGGRVARIDTSIDGGRVQAAGARADEADA
eukprot:5689794-Prymnesium_polylepis.1